MIKHTKKIAALMFAVVIALSSVFAVNAAGRGVLADDISQFTAEVSDYITEVLEEAASETGWDVVVNVNRNNVDYDETEKTAYKYAKNNGIENGVLFQFDLGSRELQIIEQGEAMEYFNDSRIETMKSAVVSFMREDEYADAIITFASYVTQYYHEGKPVSGKFTNIDTDEKYNSKFTYTLKHYGVFIGIGSVIIAFIIVMIINGKYKHHGKQGTYNLDENSSVDLNVEVDEFVTKHVTSRTIRDDSDNDSSGGSGSSRGIGGSSF